MTSFSWRVLALAPLVCTPLAAQRGRLSAPLVPGGDVVDFQLAPDGTRVVYRADQDIDGVFELYVVGLDGGTPVRLNGALVAGGSVGGAFGHAFRISPDGSRVVYLADQEQDEVRELFSAPLDGSGPAVKLSGALVAGGNVQAVPPFAPDEAFAPMTSAGVSGGARVLYVADQDQDEVLELYSAPLDGSQPAVKLSGPFVAGGDVALMSPSIEDSFWPQLSPDGSRAVYCADQERDEVIELYSVPVDGSEPATRLNRSRGLGRGVLSALVSPDSSNVLFLASRSDVGPTELFRVPLEGTPARVRRTDDRDRISLPLAPFQAARVVSITPDGTRAVYAANLLDDRASQLHSVPIAGAHPSVELSHFADGRVRRTAHGGGRVVYSAGHDDVFDTKVFSVPVDGSEDRVRLSALGYVEEQDFELSPDARRVVYKVSPTVFQHPELHSVPLDGSEAPTRLDPPGTRLGSFRVSPDGRDVLYVRAETLALGAPLELHAVPIDGSRPSRRLSAALVPGGSVRDGRYAATAAGRVVYLADQETDEVVELFVTSLVPAHRRAP